MILTYFARSLAERSARACRAGADHDGPRRACSSARSAVIPGGVNSPVRAFRSVGGDAVLRRPGRGPARLGRRGQPLRRPRPVLRRHHPRPRPPGGGRRRERRGQRRHVVRRADGQARCVLAEAIIERVPSVEQVRLVSSGTEATMTAIRVARGVHRPVEAGEVRRQLPRPLRRAARRGRHGDGLARPARLGRGDRRRGGRHDRRALQRGADARRRRRLRDRRTDRRQHGSGRAGRRLPRGPAGRVRPRRRAADLRRGDHRLPGRPRRRPGAVRRDARPDHASARCIGGGLPIAAFGGRADVMDVLAPLGPVYQAGTLSGNPLATAAGWPRSACCTPASTPTLRRAAARFGAGLAEAFASAGVAGPGPGGRARWSGCYFGDELADRLRRRQAHRRAASTPRSSTPCSTAASPSPPAPTRSCSRARPTATTSSTASSRSPPTPPPSIARA